MHRDEYGRFVKDKKNRGAVDALTTIGAGGVAGAATAAGAGKLGEVAISRQKDIAAGAKSAAKKAGKLSEIIGEKTGNKLNFKPGKDLLAKIEKGASSKASQLSRLLKKAGGVKGLALKGGAGGLGVGAGVAALAELLDDDEEEDEDEEDEG